MRARVTRRAKIARAAPERSDMHTRMQRSAAAVYADTLLLV